MSGKWIFIFPRGIFFHMFRNFHFANRSETVCFYIPGTFGIVLDAQCLYKFHRKKKNENEVEVEQINF